MREPGDLDKLQGRWAITALEVDGRPVPAAMIAGARIEIQGDRFTSTGMGADYTGSLELNEAASPRELTILFASGPENGNTNLGIYEFVRDGWKLCLATRGTTRPSSFATTPGSGFALETLSRDGKGRTTAKAPKSSKGERATPPDSASTEFEGEWKLVSAVMDGVPMEQSMVQWVKRITRGNHTTVYAGPQVMLAVDFTYDRTQNPNSIDYRNTAGSNKGKTQLGIYAFEGDLLTFHVAAPGAPRPSNFEPGKKGTLTVWKRA